MMLKRLEDATASLGERSITSYMRSEAENVRGLMGITSASAKAMQEEKRLPRRYSERKRAVDNPVHAEQGGECAGLVAV